MKRYKFTKTFTYDGLYVESTFLVLDACDPRKRPILVDKDEFVIIGRSV